MEVEHVVVLMFENRSFDHLLGHLDHGSLDPITVATSNADPQGRSCSAHFLPSDADVAVANRLFAHAAQSDGLLKNVVKHYKHRTTFAALGDEGISWAVYAGDIPQAAAYFHLVDAFKDRFDPLAEFFDDVRDDTLPAYSFIEPHDFVTVDSQHPIHSVILGDQVLRSVYAAIAGTPEVRRSTLLLVTWDEHAELRRPTPALASAPPATATPEELDLVVSHFQHEHMGNRAARLRGER
jgi:phospholipase C